MKSSWKCKSCSAKNLNLITKCKKCKTSRDGSSSSGSACNTFVSALLKHKKPSDTDLQELNKLASSSASGRKDRAILLSADPALSSTAEYTLREDFFSKGTIRSYSSEVRLYEQIVMASGIVPWPVSALGLTRFSAVLKALQYRGSNCYLSAVVTANGLQGHRLDDNAKFHLRLCRSSVCRDIGDDFSVEPITLKLLADVAKIAASLTPLQLLVSRLAVVGVFFCFRPSELVGLRGFCYCAENSPCSCGSSVRCSNKCLTITLRGDKTHQDGALLPLSLSCDCKRKDTSAHAVPLCPVCAVNLLYRDSRACPPKKWWLAQGSADKPLSYTSFHKTLVDCMKLIGRTVKIGNRHMYGGQSMRRGGAQALACAGWSLALIRLWGRWAENSRVIERYVQKAPLWRKDLHVTKSIRGSIDDVPTSRF